MPTFLYRIEAWKKMSQAEILHLEKIQASKRIFNQPITTPYTGLITETGVWSAEQRINYSSLMLYHNIINSSKDRLARQKTQEQRVQNDQSTFYEKVRTTAEEKLETGTTMKKSEQKRTIKDKGSQSNENGKTGILDRFFLITNFYVLKLWLTLIKNLVGAY